MKNAPQVKRRLKKLKDGTLEVYYAKHPDDGCDVIYQNGDGTSSADRALLYYIFGCERQRVPMGKTWLEAEYEPSLVDELVKRGYDITTLKFSIRKRR